MVPDKIWKRRVAQLADGDEFDGRTPALGAGGTGFNSLVPDQVYIEEQSDEMRV